MSIIDELRGAVFSIHADDALFINDRGELDPLGADYIPEARVTAAIDAADKRIAKLEALVEANRGCYLELTAERNLCEDRAERLKVCGDALLRRYTELVESGDAGFWDWHVEKECIDWMAERSTP